MELKQLDILVNLQKRPDFLKTFCTIEPLKYSWIKHLEDIGFVTVEERTEFVVRMTDKGKQQLGLV